MFVLMKKRNIKAVFFDVDGTLVSFNTHKVPASTEKAIEELKSKNIKVIISTGRSINSLDHVRYLDFDGYITFNGGYCVDSENDILLRSGLDARDVQSVLSEAQNNPLSFSFMSEKEITIHNVTPDIASVYAQLNLPVPPIGNYENFDTNSVLQANIFIPSEEEKVFMNRVMPNSVASRWSPLFADVNPKGQSKMNGVEVFCKQLNIPLEDTVSFGDGGNDIEMIKHTGIGVAMGNANKELKDFADYVTDDVDDDGIWNALKYHQVI